MSADKEMDKDLESVPSNLSDTDPTTDLVKIIEWVNQLKDKKIRINALIQLSKKRESFPDLAIYLWYTPGVIAAL
jgi:CCR4-NOT transcription complex subunit 9